ncbi:hypothetical protein KX729_06960 [Rhizobium sp. XQZ8]|uniref:hypothetical protein n=1 Tax=Rhizobium populisoli TaxID=2859785 RepID=UPI001CA5CA5E|nr:hypothetical protein [Rhizobium populisoli]MBW6421178.1 hypothetical protein [Rhizobium populisoli]
MTTIGSTNPYYVPSLLNISGNKNGKGGSSEGGDANSLPRQAGSGGITGSDTVFGAKLADALWSMESQGVEVDQPAGDTWLGDAPSTAIEDQFMDMSKKTLAERIRDQYLEAHGLSEDSLAAMSPEEREAVEAEIRKAILEAMGVNGKKQDTAMNMGAGAGDTQQGGAQAGNAPLGGVQPTAKAGSKKNEDDLFSA